MIPNLHHAKACFGCEHSVWTANKSPIDLILCTKHQEYVRQINVCDDWEED